MSSELKTSVARPFLKWAGGKTQLLPAIENALPKDFATRKSLTYVEPFVGSGAVCFWMLQRFPNIKHAIINDVNTDLVQAYNVIKNRPRKLIAALEQLQEEYYRFRSEQERKSFFLGIRELFNQRRANDIEQSSWLIFLNRTCFNGLYRVNSKNEFNVPFGRYPKPRICDPETIMADSHLLKRVTILNGDYQQTFQYAGGETFFYFDPPYKPISETSSFTSYGSSSFDDNEQRRLKLFCDKLSSLGHQWLLSNSDPSSAENKDKFFDELYSGEGVHMQRVKAKRMINSKAGKRGEINELLISNYKPG